LQTDQYAAAAAHVSPWLSAREAASVAARHAQRCAVLGKLGGDFRFVLTESALASWPGDPGLAAGQFAALAEAADWPGVAVGLVPAGPQVRRLPLCGFTLYDDAAVSIETFTGELLLTDRRDVEVYRSVFEDFASAAVYGKDMRAVLGRSAEGAQRAAVRLSDAGAE
jgi:hypothetical protein